MTNRERPGGMCCTAGRRPCFRRTRSRRRGVHPAHCARHGRGRSRADIDLRPERWSFVLPQHRAARLDTADVELVRFDRRDRRTAGACTRPVSSPHDSDRHRGGGGPSTQSSGSRLSAMSRSTESSSTRCAADRGCGSTNREHRAASQHPHRCGRTERSSRRACNRSTDAGGRLADDSHAPQWWTFASPDNHGVDIAAWGDYR